MNRFNLCVKIPVLLFFMVCSVTVQALGQTGGTASGTDVVIVYATGNVHTGTGKADATSTPTPAEENMKTIAGKLVSALTAKKISAKAVPVSEVKTPDEMMKSKLIVLGSPAYFSNVSWQFKKFIDEQFMLIWRQNNRLDNHKVATFCMAAEESSTNKILEILKDLVVNSRGISGPSMTVSGKNTPVQIKEEVDTFADEIEAFIK